MAIRNFTRTKPGKYCIIIFSAVIYSIAISVFVNPLHLFSGGIMGLSQLIRSILTEYLHVPLPERIDISGIIYYLINIPLLVLAYRKISRSFFIKTLVSTTIITIITSLIKINTPVIEDTLTSCIIGGLLAGIGVGLALMAGGSGGGMDIVGMYISMHKNAASIGKVSLVFNLILYVLSAILFDIETAVYSIILTIVNSTATDRMHYQNIMVQAMIFTKKDNVADPIMKDLYRGVTEWQGDGAYTKEDTHILVTMISKYEVNRLSKIVRQVDPHAFVSYSQVTRIDGNFLKKLQG